MQDVVNALLGPDPLVFQQASSVGLPWSRVQGLLQNSKTASLSSFTSPLLSLGPDTLVNLINPFTEKPFATREEFIVYLLQGNPAKTSTQN